MRVLEQHLYLITLLSKIWFLLQWHQVKGETFNGTWTYFLKIVTFDLHLFSLVTFSSSSFIKTNINPKAFVCKMVWIWWRISWLITGKFASNKTLRSVLPPSLPLSVSLSVSLLQIWKRKFRDLSEQFIPTESPSVTEKFMIEKYRSGQVNKDQLNIPSEQRFQYSLLLMVQIWSWCD